MDSKPKAGSLFVARNTENSRYALKKWLSERDFNNFSSGWKDKRGNDGIGLVLDLRGKPIQKNGVIVCVDNNLAEVVDMVENHLANKEQKNEQ